VEWGINCVDKLRTRLSSKLFLATFLMLFSVFWLSFGIATTLIPELYIRQFTTRFEDFVINFGYEISGLPLVEVKDAIDRFAAYNNAIVVLSSGQDVIHTINAMTIMDSTSPLVETSWVFRQDPLTGARFTISAQTHLESVNHVRDLLQQIFHSLLIGIVFVALVVAYLFSASVSDPIVKLSQTAKKLEQLDLSALYEIKRADEIGDLSFHLNIMAQALNATLTDLHVANSKLQDELIFKEEQEEQRSKLFTALSHELKTPLVILKGELEGMIDNVGVYEDRDAYLKKAYRTTESMEKLIQEILLVSRLESNEITLNVEPLNMSDLINETCRNYESLATFKHVSLLYYCEDDLFVQADRFQIKSVISNIINNAIFHSEAGEVVWIQFEKQETNGVLTVKNKGNIPEEDLAQLFEPFYRVEKSRNRHSGGSGLGLFIVKSMLELHQFEHHLENEQEFVVFTAKFPISAKEGITC